MADVKDATVPDIGDFTDVPVVEVHVEAGAAVAVDDPLITLETDKASMDVPAPFAGTVEELLLKVGDVASQGTVVARIAASENGAAPEEGEEDGARAEAAADRSIATAVSAEASAEAETKDAPPPKPIDTPPDDAAPPYASPSARRLAREKGIDLSTVEGTGRKGRIVPEDLESAQDGGATPARPSGPAKEGEERVALTRIQQRSAANLAASWPQVPLVTHNDDADITDLEAFRKQLNAEQDDVKVTMVALLLKACASALDAFPRFASALDGDELVIKHQRHLGFAADTPNGLVVPVVRDADRKGILELAGELTELSGAARAGKLAPKDMSGSVFTISSLGGIGGTSFTPLVNPPQVAILGVVRSAMKPVWDGAQFVPRLMLPLSLSYDHRVIDGAAAARFTAHLAKVLGDLRRVLL